MSDIRRIDVPLSVRRKAEAQIDVIADILRRGWRSEKVDSIGRSGEQQASFLAEFIERHWRALDEPCARSTIDVATRATANRRVAFDPGTAVLIHGDAHPANVLEDPLRDWTTERLMGDPAALGRAWCARMGAAAGVDPEAIWEWAFAERVSTGLFLLSLGDRRGRRFLEVADAWATDAFRHRV